MRFFTSLMAVALLFTACNKGEFFAAEDSQTTRGGNGSMIGFHKVVLCEDGSTRPAKDGEFTFEVYTQKTNDATLVLFATLPTLNGGVWINFPDLQGNSRILTFREKFANEEEAAKWVTLEDFTCDVVPKEGGIWDGELFYFNDGPTIVNIPIPEEPIIEPVLGPEHKSVTLVNAAGGVHPNHNHFCYAELTRDELFAGVVLDMVEGNGCVKVGEAFVKVNEANKIIIEFDGVSPEIQGFARTELVINENNPNSAHNITHRNEPIDCPEGDLIYLFVHLDPVQFWVR